MFLKENIKEKIKKTGTYLKETELLFKWSF